jgi:hypothetical protein
MSLVECSRLLTLQITLSLLKLHSSVELHEFVIGQRLDSTGTELGLDRFGFLVIA